MTLPFPPYGMGRETAALLTPAEVAERWKVSKKTVLRLIDAGGGAA